MGIQNNHPLQVTHIFHYLGGAGDTALVIRGCDTKKARLTQNAYFNPFNLRITYILTLKTCQAIFQMEGKFHHIVIFG